MVYGLLILLLSGAVLAQAEDCVQCSETSVTPILSGTQIPYVPDLVQIASPTLRRNPRGTYCTRREEVVDTIVLHHSAGPSGETIQEINENHLGRRSDGQQWHMLGYHYTINAAYPNEDSPAALVSQGRPFNMVGSHAGGNVFRPVSASTRVLMSRRGAFSCGEPPLRRNLARANMYTVGILIIGNYAPLALDNLDGYDPRHPRRLTSNAIDLTARLACQIQRDHPRVINIQVHSDFHPTLCPGQIAEQLQQIKAATRRYGCLFN